MNATTTMPTIAPISSVRTRKTCSSRFRRNDAHCCDEESHQFFWSGSRVPLKSISGSSLNTTILASLGRSPGLLPVWRRAAVFQQRADGIHQRRAARAQLADAVSRHLLEQFLSPRQKRYQDAPAVVPASAPAHVTVGLQPVDQFNRAVMLQRQPLRQGPDGSFFAFGKTADRQQEQILLRLQPRRLRHRVPFPDELANAVAQLRERLILRRGDFFCHQLTISQCDIYFHSNACVDSCGNSISASTCSGAACCATTWQPVDVIAALDSYGNVYVRNCITDNPGLQRLAERFLRFVMLVAAALVKLVRALANYIRADRHALATMFARPIFGGGQQSRARSQTALPFRHDEPVYFRADLNLQQRLLAHMHPADHSVFC